MTCEALFVDLDDTLYPYPECNEAGKTAAFREARDRGYDLDREGFERLYQAGRRSVKRELSGTAAAHERFLYFKRGVAEHAGTDRPGDALALGEAYWGAYLDAMSLHDGVEATLAAASEAGVDVAVVTNLTTRIQLAKLDRLGLAEHVDLVLTSEETGREKPASVMFTLPMARLGVDAEGVVMVGDSPADDVAGANALGLTTVLFDGDADGLDPHEEPDHHVDAFPAVREVAL